MGTWNTIFLMAWTAILHLIHSSGTRAELKKIGPMVAKKLWEDRIMRAKAGKAVATVETELKKAANE